MSIDITAAVNLHREGRAATPSLISAWRAINAVAAAGYSGHLMIVLDRPDDETALLAKTWHERGAQLVACDEGDLGSARNAAVAASDAEWVAFLDADDLWSENWLVNALKVAGGISTSNGPDVLHPAVNVIFGDHHSLLHHRSSDDPSFSWARFRLHNAWTALSFARRRDLAQLPFPRNTLDEGFGYEDWSWNMAVLDRGGRHHVVADTCHFIRRMDEPSLLSNSRNALRSPYLHDDEVLPRPQAAVVSDLTETDDGLPSTHRQEPHGLSAELLDQVRLAVGIEPAIAQTLTEAGRPHSLPQNFNTHVTPAQRALESVELACADSTIASISEAMDASNELRELDPDDQHRVVAEVLRSAHAARLPLGTSAMIDSTYRTYPQLTSLAPVRD